MYQRLKNLVDDCHKRICKWLYENFDYVILLKLDTNSFCRKNMSRLAKNKLKAWRHCIMIERMKFKHSEYSLND